MMNFGIDAVVYGKNNCILGIFAQRREKVK